MQAFEQADCHAVLGDGLKDLELISQTCCRKISLFSNVIGGGTEQALEDSAMLLLISVASWP